MDEAKQEPVKVPRLLAWLTAGLLVAGAVSAGAVRASNEDADRRIVSAAGAGLAGVDAATTTTEFVPPPTTAAVVPPTTTTPAPTTTAPAPTTTTTTKVPRPTTSTTSAPAPTTTKATGVQLTVVNQHTFAVKVTVNGRVFTLAPGDKRGPVLITSAPRDSDVVEVVLVQEPSCGTGDADSYFPKPGSYTMTVVASQGLCQPGMPGPTVKVTPA